MGLRHTVQEPMERTHGCTQLPDVLCTSVQVCGSKGKYYSGVRRGRRTAAHRAHAGVHHVVLQHRAAVLAGAAGGWGKGDNECCSLAQAQQGSNVRQEGELLQHHGVAVMEGGIGGLNQELHLHAARLQVCAQHLPHRPCTHDQHLHRDTKHR